ncbi:diguanylate cyclase [Methylobacter luteus]|uniref:diguanylate cyclase n=1 Tax=Methylobacter luteus TaxID=415 RepID=UPI000418660F|nr:diguanylate cyclase [Methylobacter luteus]
MKIAVFVFLILFGSITSSAPLEKVTLQLGWKYQFEFAGFIAAKEKGFYKEAGLDVDLKERRADMDVVDAVLNGHADYGVTDADLAFVKAQNKPIVLLANYFKRSALVFISKQTLLTPHDLAGKKVMITEEQLHSSSLALLLKTFHMKTDDFQIIPHSFSANDFIRGDIDAMSAFISNEPYQITQSKTPYNIIDPSAYGIHTYNGNLFTTYSTAEHQKQRAQKLITASNRGWAYALDHTEEIAELIYKKYSQEKPMDGLLYEAAAIKKLILPDIAEIGSVNRELVQHNFDALKAAELIAPSADLNSFFFDAATVSKEPLFSKQELAYIQALEKISLCVHPQWMPYERIEHGRHIGISADYFNLLQKMIPTPIRLVRTSSWTQSLEFARQRKCDILSLVAPTPERKKYWNFTPPYLSSPLVIATRTDELFVADIENVLDKKLGIIKGHAFSELLRNKYPSIDLIEFDTLDEGLDKVAQGELFGFLDSLATIGYALQNHYISELKIAGKFDDKHELGIGIRNDDPKLLTIFEKMTNAIPAIEHQAIINKWIAVKYEKGTDHGLLWKALAGMVVIGLLLLYRHLVQAKYLKEIAKQNELLLKLSITDKLTQVYNRAKLDDILQEQFDLYQRYRRPFSIIMMDIDHFKSINDNCGHLTGDAVLIDIADILKNHIRHTDIVGRWGGEEFMIICLHNTVERAAILAEKLRAQIKAHHFKHEQQITASFGVAQISDGINIEQLVKQADDALYKAKNAGRNKVITDKG